MEQTIMQELEPPRFEEFGPALITGLGERCSEATSAAIPAQWQRFVPHIGQISGQTGRATYGVICNGNGDGDGNREYICGVEVSSFSNLPAEFRRLRLAKQKYAVFAHRGHVSAIRGTWNAIWNRWAPESGARIADVPEFERYSEGFDPIAGVGGMEIWIPLEGQELMKWNNHQHRTWKRRGLRSAAPC